MGFKPATPDLRAYALTTTPQKFIYVIIPDLTQHFYLSFPGEFLIKIFSNRHNIRKKW